jgi:hypothetical protein
MIQVIPVSQHNKKPPLPSIGKSTILREMLLQ